MATIESFIKIGDGFTTPLDNLYSKLDRAANGFSNLKNKMNFNGVSKPPTGDYESFNQTLGKTNSLFRTMTGASLAATGISKVVGVAAGSVKSFVSELNESSVAWQTFDANMTMLGMNKSQIDNVRADLQKYAQDTIYSSSDMASTYSQLAAVGVQSADKLVKGFGGLAAAATDPVQAMKTLSQQGTQMAAKPTVQWQDFKLMMEQTPAGMSAVARTMHRSAQQLLQDVQAGTVKTQDFFDAVAKTGTNAQFSKLATTYKTVGQAMDGLRETAANKLKPVFDGLNSAAINSVNKIIDKFSDLDFKKTADRLTPVFKDFFSAIDRGFNYSLKVGQNFFKGLAQANIFKGLAKEANAARDAFSNITSGLFGSGGKQFDGFQALGKSVGNVVNTITNVLTGMYQALANMNPSDVKLLALSIMVLRGSLTGFVFTGLALFFTWLNTIKPSWVRGLANSLVYLAATFAILVAGFKLWNGMKSIKSFNLGNLFGGKPKTPKMPEPPKAPTGGAGEWLKFAGALILVGIAVIAIATGFFIMAQAAIALSNAGWGAIAVFAGMIGLVVGLAVAVAVGGSAMLSGSVGFLIFGAAVLLVGAGLWLLFAGLAMVLGQVANVATYGMQAAINLIALSGSITLFALAAAAAGVLMVIFGAGLVIVGAAMLVATIGAIALGAGAVILGAGLFIVGAALFVVAGGLYAVAGGVYALYSVISTIFSDITGIISGFGSALVNAGKAIINGFINGLKSAWEAGKKFISGIGNWIKEHKGPISYDRTLLTPHGNAIMAGFGEGIANGFSSVKSNISAMTGDIANGVNLQPGDLLAASFDRAKGALTGLVDGMKQLDANGNIDVNGNVNGAPTNSSLADQVGFTSTNKNDYSRRDNSQSINISDGAIQITGTNNAEYDGEMIVNQLETYLKGKQDGSLA